VNPLVVEGPLFSTTRRLITALARRVELIVVPVSGYDFRKGTVRAFRRLRGGGFEALGTVKPRADLWIVYSDGYYLDHRQLGFKMALDYFEAQLEFNRRHLDSGAVRLMVNTPEAEAQTLKSWLTSLDFRATKVIPTWVFEKFDEVCDFRKAEGCVVAKPVWGGGSLGVRKLANEASLVNFRREWEDSGAELSDYCFQPFRRGDAKRLWFAGGEFVGARRFRGRAPDVRAARHPDGLSRFHRRRDQRSQRGGHGHDGSPPPEAGGRRSPLLRRILRPPRRSPLNHGQ